MSTLGGDSYVWRSCLLIFENLALLLVFASYQLLFVGFDAPQKVSKP